MSSGRDGGILLATAHGHLAEIALVHNDALRVALHAVWGKSNVARGATIVMSTNGSTETAPGQRRAADRSVTATVKVTRKTYLAVKDVAGRGPSRLVGVR